MQTETASERVRERESEWETEKKVEELGDSGRRLDRETAHTMPLNCLGLAFI